MKKLTLIVSLLLSFAISAFADQDEEISLFGAKGNATAYIAEDLTIYSWTGKPRAYLSKNEGKNGFHVYGFNGKHLGWFTGGVVYDHEGKAVGAVKEVFADGVEFEPFKAFKEFKPFKAFKEFAPFQPVLVKKWAGTSLKLFLMQGTAE